MRPRDDADGAPLSYGGAVSPFPGWWGGARPTLALPAAVAVFGMAGTTFSTYHQTGRAPDAVAVALVLAGPLALVVRRWNPPVVLGVVGAVLVAYLALGYPYGPVYLATVVALVSAVGAGHRVTAYAVVGAIYAGTVVVGLVRDPGAAWGPAATTLAWLVAVCAAAEGLRARRERLTQARAAREETERRQGVQERLRIAQELHDVLGHHVSLINVQAGVALYLMDDDPEQARTALTAIKQSSKELLREMRSTLGVLRGVDEQPPHHPVPGLAQLDALVADTRAAGLPVRLDIRGERRDLPPHVDLAAYRIVQEALTNTRRHAGAAEATVTLDYSGPGVTVDVCDNGRGDDGRGDDGTGTPGEPGNGLAGMRERATALGGTITAAPAALGGFRVHAWLPA